ncbi:MAG: ABC transporter substrate-binding protein [Pseudomonadota bacterium]
MIRLTRHFACPMVALIWVILVTAPAPAGEGGRISRLVIGTTMGVRGIDIDDYYFGILRAMLTHKGLVRLNDENTVEGDLAESWSTEDFRTWTFRLKQGMVWHDGSPVLADDVAFSLNYLREKLPEFRTHLSLLDSAHALDAHTVVIRLKEPSPRFLYTLLVLRVIPSHVFKEIADPRRFNQTQAATGCGPYAFESHDPASGTLVFRAFPQYYRGIPHIDQIVFRLFRNPDTLYLALRKGEIDLPYFYAAGTPPIQVPHLKRDSSVRIHLLENTGVPHALFFNTHNRFLESAQFRRALSLAIDYREILDLIAPGYGYLPNSGFVPRACPEFVDTPPLVHAPDQARQILDRMEVKDTNADGVREKDGNPVRLDLVLRMDIPEHFRLAALVKEYFLAVGIELVLRPVDMTLFRTISDQDRSYAILLSRTTPWGMIMGAGCGSEYLDSRNLGWTRTDDPGFFAIVDRMRGAVDTVTYQAAAADFQLWVSRELPVIPLYWDRLVQPCSARFEGWRNSPMYGVLWEETWFSLRKTEP